MASGLVMLPCSDIELLVSVRETLVAALEARLPPSGSGEGEPAGDGTVGTAEGRSKLLPPRIAVPLNGHRPPLAEARLYSFERRR